MTRHSEESEKALESFLCRRAKELGGVALKFASSHATGFPDRLVLLPGATVGWAEMKSKGKKATRLQLTRIRFLRLLGFPAEVIDSREGIEEFLMRLSQKS